jgi:SAM-dependent methyltransferase
MSDLPPPGARAAPATARNRDPILLLLRRWLPEHGRVLEIAAGTGEHAIHFAAALPGLDWRPTDPDPTARASIAAWRQWAALPNLCEPLALDAADPASWPVDRADAIVCINMVHISPWSSTLGLLEGAARILPEGGVVYLYGPYLERGIETAPSNLAFDDSLKDRDPAWGLRLKEDLLAAAAPHGLVLAHRVAMPSNNLSLLLRKGAA